MAAVHKCPLSPFIVCTLIYLNISQGSLGNELLFVQVGERMSGSKKCADSNVAYQFGDLNFDRKIAND